VARDAPVVQLETPRLVCEPIRALHAAAMFSVLSDDRLYAYMPGGPPENLASLERDYAFLAGAKSPDGSQCWLNWIVFLRDSREAIGFTQATIGAQRCSIAYVLGVAHQGRGYAREAVASMLSHLFAAYELPRVQAEIHFDNRASSRLALRLGFELARKDYAENDDMSVLTRETWLAQIARWRRSAAR